MVKFSIVVKDKGEESGNCTVKIETLEKQLEKAKDNEKTVAMTVYQAITKALQDLQSEGEKLNK